MFVRSFEGIREEVTTIFHVPGHAARLRSGGQAVNLRTNMDLNLQKPTLVLLGVWNQAIFQPGWIARYLFEFPENTALTVSQLMLVEPQGPGRVIQFFGAVGICILNDRFEIYLTNFEEQNTTCAELVIRRLVTTLPHTPLGAFGVNFNFRIRDPEPELLDRLQTKDDVELIGRIIHQQFLVSIDSGEGEVLNLRRTVTESETEFDFNFHHPQINAEGIEAQFERTIQRHLAKSLEIMAERYQLTDYSVVAFDPSEAEAANRETN